MTTSPVWKNRCYSLINILGISAFAAILIFIIIGPILITNNNDGNLISTYQNNTCAIINSTIIIIPANNIYPVRYISVWKISNNMTALISPISYDINMQNALTRMNIYPIPFTYQCYCDKTMIQSCFIYPSLGMEDSDGDFYVQCYLDTATVRYMQRGIISYDIGIALTVIGYGATIVISIITIIMLIIYCIRKYKTNHIVLQ
jgi:hypothetical protein